MQTQNTIRTVPPSVNVASTFLKPASLSGTSASLAAVRHFAAAHEVFGEGDNATHFYKVQSGVVRTCRLLADGRRHIEAFHGEGEIFGLEAGGQHRFSAQTLTECTVTVYRSCNAAILAGRDEALARELFSCAMRSMARAQEHAILVGSRSAIEKVAAFLVGCAIKATDRRTIWLDMTRVDIADYLGMTIETVSRTLSLLERDQVIDITSARQITLRKFEYLEELCA